MAACANVELTCNAWFPRLSRRGRARLRGDSRPPQRAASGIAYGLTDDAWLANGPGTVDDRVATLDGLGVQVVRFTVRWDQVAPTEPGVPDRSAGPGLRLVDAERACSTRLHAHGIDVVLQLDGAPSWSNGGKPSNYVPTSAKPFGAFATAVAREYPWVKKFQIWNEPNQARWLRPTSAPLYVTRLLNPAYAAIHAATAGAKVAGGGTAPRGSTGGVSPIAWITGDASRRRAARRLRAQPVSARPEAGDAAPRACVQDVHDGHDGDAQPARAARRARTSRARASG